MKRLSPSERRTILLAAAVVVPALLFIYGVRPYRAALADTRDQLESEQNALARERSAIAAARLNPGLRRAADSAGTAMSNRLFSGQDPVVMSAELATYLGDRAQRARVWLQDASTRPATSADGVRALHVDLRGESDLRGLLRLLDALERGSKLVRIDRLDVTVSQRGEPGSEALTLAATVSAFALPEEQ